jgi:hypothetical protein
MHVTATGKGINLSFEKITQNKILYVKQGFYNTNI